MSFLHRQLLKMDPEKAHRWAVRAMSLPRAIRKPLGLFSRIEKPCHSLGQTIWGLDFPNPVGLAAGVDKDAKAILGWKDLGFGFVEVGSVTPQPQPGNHGDRLWRVSQHRAAVNWYGKPSQGSTKVLSRVIRDRGLCVLGVNVSDNKDCKSVIEDFESGANRFGPWCDYLVLNVSCPNSSSSSTYHEDEMRDLLLDLTSRFTVLLKVSPKVDVEHICRLAQESRVQGLVVCNTMPSSVGYGGWSGFPLQKYSDVLIRRIYSWTKGTMPIIGLGGVMNAQDAYRKIRCGASLIQLFTGLVYGGPHLVDQIVAELPMLLQKDGLDHISQAIGVDAHKEVV